MQIKVILSFPFQMASSDSVTTCLSPAVHYVICKLGFEKKAIYDINNIVSENGEVCWQAITEHVCYLESDRSVDYIESIRSLGPVCESVNLHFKSLTKDKFVVQYALWFQWTNYTELFLEVFDVLQYAQSTEVALGLMKLTSCLERALGDVYLLIGKDCPFLLRDLLASEQLAVVFGEVVMDVLRIFIGSPYGLNLRNVLWHGFASPEEIPAKYCAMLLFLTAGLGQLLQIYLLKTKHVLVHRPYVTFIRLEDLDAFPDLNHETLSVVEELLQESNFVLRTMLPFWMAALTAFKQSRYADCVILLLPQLEAGLRLLFTTTNKCPNRLLTAEVNFYLKSVNGTLYAYLYWCVSPQEFLWDYLNHQEGPRIRDHLSHGEINLKAFPREIANQLLAFAITLLCRFSHEDMVVFKEHLIIKPLMNCASCYHSRFHPISRLKKQVSPCKLCDRHICTLYSPRPVLEVLVVLRKICTQCHQVSAQVIASIKSRYQQWTEKTLRSRQRHNYLRMLNSIKFLSPVLRLILVLITLELVNVHLVCKKNPSDYHQYLKFLKSVLQYTENLVTYTSPEKNKWDETMQLTNKALLKIRKFSDGKLTLIQSAT
uniref:ER membrane associated RNA degradation n=1 Tax=Phasianus colchicus TaxID=9054 RepID=A0A669P429_PHACC